MNRKEERKYYDFLCDIINIVEGNYEQYQIGKAYNEAMAETRRLDKKWEKEEN
jgi:hypothetical protein